MSVYLDYARFLFPLVLTTIVQGLAGQVLNGGMARMPEATETLAAYGLAFGITGFLLSPLLQVRQLGMVLVDSQRALHKVQRVVLVFAALLSGALIGIALTPAGVWVVEVLHELEHALSAVALIALACLAPLPVLHGLLLFYQGLLVRIRRTGVISAATIANIGTSIAATFALLPARVVRAAPIALPLIVTYTGLLVELGIVLWGYRRHVRGALPAEGRVLSYRYIVRFFWPLALTMAVQGFSRPLINLFVSRGAGGAEALAVLTVVYPLANLPYGWLNEIRALPAAFQEQRGSLRTILRFALGCGALVFAVMLAMFWTPARATILRAWIGVEAALAQQARAPLMVFTAFPLVVMCRAYLHGVGLVEHRTRALAPSGPARMAAILVVLLALSPTDVPGATHGVAALLAGFIAETAVVWLGVRGPWRERLGPVPV
ncbi:MAG: hypothetical protein JXA09_06765 [Anaerolineae bacterium]|nr:hypothetical protein [Anaerolineae bacterium]